MPSDPMDFLPEEGTLKAALQRAVAVYDALSPVDKALHDAEQRRSFVRGQTGREPAPDVLADEVRRLRAAYATDLAALRAENAQLSDQVHELQQAPWPKWAQGVLDILNARGIVDVRFDDEVDLPDAVRELLSGDDLERENVEVLQAENTQLRTALKGLLAEWDKFTRYGGPIARQSNEAVNFARTALGGAS